MLLKNGLALDIKEAIPQDAKQIITYLNQVGGESDHLTFGANEFFVSEEDEIKIIENTCHSESSIYLCGWLNNELVSLASVQGYAKKRMAHRSSIGISVKEKYWRMGIGKAMMNEVLCFARNCKSLEYLELEVATKNVGAVKLYESLGFEVFGSYEQFFKLDNYYLDALYMKLDVRFVT